MPLFSRTQEIVICAIVLQCRIVFEKKEIDSADLLISKSDLPPAKMTTFDDVTPSNGYEAGTKSSILISVHSCFVEIIFFQKRLGEPVTILARFLSPGNVIKI